MNDEEVAELRALATRMLGLTREQEKTIDPKIAELTAAENGNATTGSSSSEEIWRVARLELARKRGRAEFLPPELATGAGWAILLDLFDQEQLGRKVSITGVCAAALVPTTTALRYLGVLFDLGLVERINDRQDARRVHVRLALKGEEMVKNTLQRQIEIEKRVNSDWLKVAPSGH